MFNDFEMDDEEKILKNGDNKRKFANLMISPMRPDVFDMNTDENPFAEAMKMNQYQKDKKAFEEKLQNNPKTTEPPRKRNRWDEQSDKQEAVVLNSHNNSSTEVNMFEETPGRALTINSHLNQWAETPMVLPHFPACDDDIKTPLTRSRFDETPKSFRSETPKLSGSETPRSFGSETPIIRRSSSFKNPELSTRADMSGSMTPQTSRKRSRWDETPVSDVCATPIGMKTPEIFKGVAFTPSGSTPAGVQAMHLSTPSVVMSTPHATLRVQVESKERAGFLTDSDLDEILPEGFRIVQPPANYSSKINAAKRITGTPTPMASNKGFEMKTPGPNNIIDQGLNNFMLGITDVDNEIPVKPEDLANFQLIFENKDESLLTAAEKKKKEIMTLVLKIKNGLPKDRRSAMREITKRAVEFGPQSLFEVILQPLISQNLEDQERHLLVKLLDRILYKLEDKVGPYVHKILVVMMPFLIEEDRFARQEGREVISNLAKAAGLAGMISALRPDIDNMDEAVRKVTSCALAVVAHSLGLQQILPFLKAVCNSKKSWQARHTGIRVVQQIAITMKCAILPFLNSLVSIIENCLNDEQQQVRTMTALAISALAEASYPYGIEAFDRTLKPLWKGVRQYRGKNLAAFLKAIGFLIPLMKDDYSNYYFKEVMDIIIREFQTPDENMKLIILHNLKTGCVSSGIEANYIKETIVPPFLKSFWNSRNALNKVIYPALVDTMVQLMSKVGVMEILGQIINNLKDDSEVFRKMVIETIDKILSYEGIEMLDDRTIGRLIDGLVSSFEEQTLDQGNVVMNSIGSIMGALGIKCKPYIPAICSRVQFRMNNNSDRVRLQAADMIAKIAPVIKICDEKGDLLQILGQVMYEYLGEEYPQVLASILRALNSIVRALGVNNIVPPVNELLPRLTPILKNRTVHEDCLQLIGYLAEMAHDQVSSREWMRICFDLIEILKSPEKSIRRAAINTFGYIANAVGPNDVLAVLLNNLKVQERKNRICSTVAIAVVADMCKPFTVLPAVMNEYRVPDINVQNGVLKSLSFMFEYIGDVVKDYIYAVTPLLEEALIERDIVHRQTAISAVAHLSLGVYGYDCEDALIHLLNCVWPNMLETSPHIHQAFMQSIDCLRVSLGSCTMLPYVIQGLYHPAQAVRRVAWKVYNTLYIGNPDGLVAGYPRVENDEKHTYTRYALEYKI